MCFVQVQLRANRREADRGRYSKMYKLLTVTVPPKTEEELRPIKDGAILMCGKGKTLSTLNRKGLISSLFEMIFREGLRMMLTSMLG